MTMPLMMLPTMAVEPSEKTTPTKTLTPLNTSESLLGSNGQIITTAKHQMSARRIWKVGIAQSA